MGVDIDRLIKRPIQIYDRQAQLESHDLCARSQKVRGAYVKTVCIISYPDHLSRKYAKRLER
jgi:hypothetical protein